MSHDLDRRARALLSVTSSMSPDARAAFLESVCGDDTETMNRVTELATTRTAEVGDDATLRDDTTHLDDRTVLDDAPRGGSAAAAAPGGRIGPYLLKRVLGEGGMGVVFEAEQEHPIRRTVALKLVKAGVDSRRVLARFESERQALALMSHPNIARVYDAGTTDLGQPYFAMEYTEGVPVTAYCDRQRLGVRERLELFLTVCDGVQHAHRKGIIHRDLKPSNVLVHDRDGTPEVKIIDFGIARATEDTLGAGGALTEVGQLVGTPAYMSPEQADLNNVDVDTRTDVYALGVMLYELLAGSLPFRTEELLAGGLMEMLRRIREVEPERPSRRLATLGGDAGAVAALRETNAAALTRALEQDLDWITMRAVEKDPARRYESPAELAADLVRHLNHEPVSAGPPTISYRARKFVRRHRVGVIVAATILLSLLGGITLATVGFVRATRAEKVARFEADTSSEVIDFLVGLFEISDPGEARGSEVTAREILGRGVERIDAELEDRPDLRGRLSSVMGRVYRSLGLYQAARPLLEAAIEDQRRAFGARSPEVADTMTTLAGLLLLDARGDDTGEIRRLLDEALSIQEETLPPDAPELAATLNNLGTAARYERDYDAAIDYYTRGLRVREAALGVGHPDLIRPLSNIASLHRRQQRTAEALRCYEDALAIAERELPANHPDLATVQNNLGNLHREEERFEAARALLESALATRLEVLGEDHRQSISTLYNLGMTYQALGRDAEAVEMLQRTVDVGGRRLSPGHRFVLDSLERMTELLPRLGRDAEAEAARRRLDEQTPATGTD